MKLKWIYTARDTGERLVQKALSPVEGQEDFRFCIFPRDDRQKIYGFGGAFTDTAAMALFSDGEAHQGKGNGCLFQP